MTGPIELLCFSMGIEPASSTSGSSVPQPDCDQLCENAADPHEPPRSWRRRVRLIAKDLVAFDPAHLNFLLAARTTLALFLPLIMAQVTGWDSLIWVGLGAFLLCIGDSVEDGDRHQPVRLALGVVLGSLAFASGVLAGANLLAAVAGMAFWAVTCGLMGLWGPTAATLSLAVIWSYVELGLPAARHGFADAAEMAGLFACGGLFAMVLTGLTWLMAPLRLQRRRVAACYRRLADFAASTGHRGPVSGETKVRSAIAAARSSLQTAHPRRETTRRAALHLSCLTETADRLFSLVSAAKESGALPDLRPLLLNIATRILNRDRRTPAPVLETWDAGEAHAALRTEIHAILGLLDAPDAPRDTPPVILPPPPPSGLALLKANLTLRSVTLRHAIRYAVVMSLAVLVYWVFPKPFGYWVPLTVTVVLKPYAGMTLGRAVQRVAGTIAGLAIGMIVLPLLSSLALKTGFVAVAFFLMMSVLPFNYSLAIVCLSAGLVPFEHLLDPTLTLDVAGLRLGATLIGAALALVGGHWLWPDFEHQSLPKLIQQTTRAMAAYAAAVLAGDKNAIGPTHRRTGIEMTNLQTALQRALTEIGADSHALQQQERASMALQRLFVILNVTRLAGAWAGPADFPSVFSQALLAPCPGGAARCRALLRAAQCVPAPVHALCDALGELENAAQDQKRAVMDITPPAAAQPVAKHA
ncbi:MAG: FUSC family protein [Pseudomonadota bacterium]